MTLTDELSKLRDLHERGALNDEEFSRAKATLIDEAVERKAAGRPSPAFAAVNALRRSTGDRWIAGVCGGIARSTGLEAWVLRLLLAVLLLWGGAGLLLYALLWIFVPSD
jgi:phage shock protein PspC (stress-responsive transcriptional regulator)